jgi:pyruvate formate lyase activating enzyme
VRFEGVVSQPSVQAFPPIKGFQPNTLLDWPGKICAILFLPGCNFRCPYCHSRELVGDAAGIESIPLGAVLEHLAGQRDWIDGVVITGGEPLGQPHLRALIETLRGRGLGIKLDTNGSHPSPLAELIDAGLLDYVAMDVKAPLDERYERVAGVAVDLGAIRRSIELLGEGRVEHELRTTFCPALLDESAVLEMAAQLAGARRWILQPFRPVNCLARWLETTERPGEPQMADLVARCQGICPGCRQRGRY